MSSPRAFLSYSSEDRAAAERLAAALRAGGIDVWVDLWEVRAGDSLVEKVFDEGIAGCDVFLFLLSEASLRSRFVRHELSTAFVRRLEGHARIVPIRLDDAPAPPVICHLRWHDLSHDFDAGLRSLLEELLQPRARPPLGAVAGLPPRPRRPAPRGWPARMAVLAVGAALVLAWAGRERRDPYRGLSTDAVALVEAVRSASTENTCIEARLTPEVLHRALPKREHRALDEAAAELQDRGLLERTVIPREPPHRFGWVAATPALFLRFPEGLGYDPVADLRAVAVAASDLERTGAKQLEEVTGLPSSRLNRAVGALRQFGLADVVVPILRPPYAFARVRATARTRRLARGDLEIGNLEPPAVVPRHVRGTEHWPGTGYTRRDRRTR